MRSGKGRGGFGTALQQSAVPFFSSSPHHAPPFPSPASRLPLPPSSEHPPLTGWIPLRSHSKRSQNRYKSAEEARTVPSAHAASDLHDAGLRIQYAAFDEDGAVKLSGAEKSVQGNAWQAASAEAWVPPRRAHSGSRRTLEEGRGASRRRLLHLPRRAQSLRPHRQRMGGPAAQARRPHRPLERGRQRTDVQVAAGARQAHVTRPRRPLPNSLRDNRHSHSGQP